jgi:RNA polymerase sigma factor (sigma-70 family)
VYAEGMWDHANGKARHAPDPGLVAAARDGDAEALDALLADVFPLVYNIVGRALDGHADVDDVVQETLLRVVRGLSGLREPEAFRSWLVAIAVRQVRDREQQRRKAYVHSSALDTVRDLADPASDFVTAGISSLSLADRRRVFVQAARWLDADNRALLALWWLEEIGELEREDLAAALGLSVRHAAVRILRMKEQMQTSCMVVKALQASPGCGSLRDLTQGWDREPKALWRKRVARHVRDCDTCWQLVGDLLPVDSLVRTLPLVPVPVELGLRWTTAVHQAAGASHGAAATAATSSASRHLPTNHVPTSHVPTSHGRIARAATKRPRGLLTIGGHGGLLPVSVAAVVVGAVVGTFIAVQPSGARVPPQSTAAAHGVAVSSAAGASPSSSPTHSSAAAVPSASPSAVHSAVAAAPLLNTPPVGKKGVSVWRFNGVDTALADSRADWYYTWATDHSGITAPSGVGFVPMVWGAKSVTPANLAQAKAAGPYLLGFNEPDMSSQSNMTVDQALSLWPQLMASGQILGSPAVATGAATPGGWLDRFMSGAQANGYRVDFITLHWYGSDFDTAPAVSQLQSYFQAVYNRYHKPIWLTEYALIDFSHGTAYPTDQQQAAFVTASAQMLTSLPYVQRYAWFALPAADSGPSTGLFRSGPAVTAAGKAFETAAGG